ncbi:MAG: serine/threonine-protein kinase [Planctomycetota bacterium]
MSETVVYKSGDKIEGYKVLDELGRGAASIIYAVQDPKSKQIYALKHVQKLGDKDQRFLDQAEAEYKVSQHLDHAAFRKIPKMQKVGKLLNTKGLILLMELVDGAAMDVHPPKTFENAVDVFHQVASGLAHMHEAGYVHADMKPNNVVVDDQNRVKIIDLGQSCKVGTVKERIQGTPDYIAPEQVHRREITGKTDVYNLGATMYWTLSRKHIPTALAKEDKLVGSVDDSLMEKATPLIELNKKVHPKLNHVIMESVEVDPDKRPEMGDVADQLNLVHGILLAMKNKSKTRAAAMAEDDD